MSCIWSSCVCRVSKTIRPHSECRMCLVRIRFICLWGGACQCTQFGNLSVVCVYALCTYVVDVLVSFGKDLGFVHQSETRTLIYEKRARDFHFFRIKLKFIWKWITRFAYFYVGLLGRLLGVNVSNVLLTCVVCAHVRHEYICMCVLWSLHLFGTW